MCIRDSIHTSTHTARGITFRSRLVNLRGAHGGPGPEEPEDEDDSDWLVNARKALEPEEVKEVPKGQSLEAMRNAPMEGGFYTKLRQEGRTRRKLEVRDQKSIHERINAYKNKK
eukprot:TRINITY_DN7504_c0_g1_i2.p2 TRINITY_DN7504_c0_g1~~TRINITY_DN7504_c0_g1_i2.p2  ORF type:complete len:114 (-),score=23.86 TRINITY_DN7504_c0_g1_i2:116-457(-)